MIVAALISTGASFYAYSKGEALLGRDLGGDFAGLYGAGKILNEHPKADLYDLQLQSEIYHVLAPHAPSNLTLIFTYPPFVGALFQPFALLPYGWAYAVWLVFSAALYAASVLLLSRKLTAFLLAISFLPFLFECWIGGQLSVLGFAILAAAIHFDRAERPFASGLVAGLCCYKPTLLILLLPMLIIGRRWRTISGVAVTGAALAGASLLLVGPGAIPGFRHALSVFAELTSRTPSPFPIEKYVDLRAFLHILPGGSSPIMNVLGLLIAAGIALCTAAQWRIADDKNRRAMLWAGTLVLTLVVNIYVPIYDTTLVVIAALVAADLIEPKARPAFNALLMILYLSSILTQMSAQFLHLQILTPILIGFAFFLFDRCRCSEDSQQVAYEAKCASLSVVQR